MSENEPIPVQTAFFVVVDTDGVISVHTSEIPSVTLGREATLYDIETYGTQLVRNVGRLLAAQMVKTVIAPPVEPTVADRLSEALSKRAQED